MHITGRTRLTGLFGYPVEHTVSPAMHNAAFKSSRLNLIYLPFSIHPKNLKNTIKNLSAFNFLGINITIPFKQVVIPYLDKISHEAKLIGAVNTVLVKKGKLYGYNTDGIGFIKSLGKYNLRGKTMFLLGAGGAGYAVAIQSALSGLKQIFITDIKKDRAKTLVRKVPKGIAESVPFGKNIKEILRQSDIIVNATPIGLSAKDPISINSQYIPHGKLVYDLIYNPNKTKLIKVAKNKKCKTINGLGMLLYQGAKAFEIWTNKKAPVKVMEIALNKEIQKR